MNEQELANEADLLRRAAKAVRNLQAQSMVRSQWADWVPHHLDNLADRVEGVEWFSNK